MSSNLSSESIRQLVVETEANIKKIETFNVDFVCTTLNEWRYAVRHIVDIFCGIEEEENRVQAINHLKRAYFDSSDILVDCLLEKFEMLHSEYKDYATAVRNCVPDYAQKLATVRAAKKLHATLRDSEDRETHYSELKDSCVAVERFIEEIDSCSDEWRSEIRNMRKKDRLAFCGLAFTAVSAIVAVVALVISLF